MNHEEKDALWDLLGKAKPTEVSPFFSRNVLRAVREEKQERFSVFAVFLRRWSLVTAGACALAIAGIVWLPKAEKTDNLARLAQEVSASPDYQVISNLDELLDAERNSVWLEKPLY